MVSLPQQRDEIRRDEMRLPYSDKPIHRCLIADLVFYPLNCWVHQEFVTGGAVEPCLRSAIGATITAGFAKKLAVDDTLFAIIGFVA